MSHWKQFKSQVLTNTDAALLTKALADMGINFDTNIKNISNTWGRETVDGGFVKDGKRISLGIQYKTNAEGQSEVNLVGDFYSTGLDEATFIDRLSQNYQKHNIIAKCEDQRWNIDEQYTDENGNIVIEASQWA